MRISISQIPKRAKKRVKKWIINTFFGWIVGLLTGVAVEVRKLEHKRCVNVKERCGYRLDDKNCYALTRFSLYVFGMSLKTEK